MKVYSQKEKKMLDVFFRHIECLMSDCSQKMVCKNKIKTETQNHGIWHGWQCKIDTLVIIFNCCHANAKVQNI